MRSTDIEPVEEEFPRHGARARLLGRFDRDFRVWLDTAEGRFAVWQAREPCWAQAARERPPVHAERRGDSAAEH
jgi:hypothetical protein